MDLNNEIIRLAKKAADAWRNTDTYHQAAQIIDMLISPTPPNEPLTIEQLREMDREPVWIVDVGPHKWYGPGWAIVERDNCLVRTAKNWSTLFFERYGERWLAYRRPPEGEGI